ncbi:RNA 2'-phosphotransferase [Aurantivibrio infirmus]
MDSNLKNISKYLSFILRHKPDDIGLELDESGWASIAELIEKSNKYNISREILDIVVETNDKQRFAIDSKNNRIRANQGHSIDVELSLTAVEPPDYLLHGTATRFEQSIMSNGLSKQKRHHVHLSASESVAKAVGSRYGKPVLLKVDSKAMHSQGHEFYKTANNVWLVSEVPTKFIKKL